MGIIGSSFGGVDPLDNIWQELEYIFCNTKSFFMEVGGHFFLFVGQAKFISLPRYDKTLKNKCDKYFFIQLLGLPRSFCGLQAVIQRQIRRSEV